MVPANTVLVQRKQKRVLASRVLVANIPTAAADNKRNPLAKRVLPAHLVTVDRDKQVQQHVNRVHPESIAIAEQVRQTGKLAKTALLENFQLPEKAK